MCDKICYESRKVAEGVMRNLVKSGNPKKKGKGKLHSYSCKECRAWHIGHRGVTYEPLPGFMAKNHRGARKQMIRRTAKYD